MGEKRKYKPRKPGGGRKKLKPKYDAGKNLKEQMDAAVALYEEDCSLQSIANALNLNPIKVRKCGAVPFHKRGPAAIYESNFQEKIPRRAFQGIGCLCGIREILSGRK